LAHVASINVALTNPKVNYNHRRLGKDIYFACVWLNEILLREFDCFLGVLYTTRNKEHRL